MTGSLGPMPADKANEPIPMLPNGVSLAHAAFLSRHHLLVALLAAHAPALGAFALWMGYSRERAAIECVAVPLVLAFAALVLPGHRTKALVTTLGLVWCSSALVQVSGQATEAHFHFFIVIGFVALYQDWVPFACAILGRIVGQSAVAALGMALIGVPERSPDRPLLWAGIHAAAVFSAGIAQVVLWRSAEAQQHHATELAAELARAEASGDRRRTQGELLVSLARRNQSLIQRQLELIDDLEQGEHDPDVLDGLFRLDHLATRMRRNAESLLVLSGNEPGRRHGDPTPVSEVVRGAVAEIEDFRRVDVVTAEDPHVLGRAVADMAHLLAELIENATAFSPPDTRVIVAGQEMGGSYVLRVKDRGIGLTEQALHVRNRQLAEVPEDDLDLASMLGLHVVARLARRLGVRVTLERNLHGGTTATVVMLPALLADSARRRSGRTAAFITPASTDTRTGAGALERRASRPLAEALAALDHDDGDDYGEEVILPLASAGAWWDAEHESLNDVAERPTALTPAAAAVVAGPIATAVAPTRTSEPAVAPPADARPAPRTTPTPTPAPPTPAPNVTWATPTSTAATFDRTAAGLARRTPRSHLAPGLVGTSPEAGAQEQAPPSVYRPEEARARMERFQHGLRDGRALDGPSARPAPPLSPVDWLLTEDA